VRVHATFLCNLHFECHLSCFSFVENDLNKFRGTERGVKIQYGECSSASK